MYYRDNHSCTDCKKGLHHAVIHRCVHGSFAKSLSSVLAMSFHRMWKIYDRVSAFVCPSFLMAQELEEFGIPPEKIHQINTFAALQQKGTPDLKAPYLLYIGRLASYKGIDIAIRAFSRLKEKFPEVGFYVLGDENDDDARRVRTVIRESGADNVRLLPFERDKKRVLEWIQHALFMVVPSEFFENLPNTILESFSCGRPVIATRFGSMPDIVKEGEYGLLYELGNSGDLAEKMSWLISQNEERERMGNQAYEALRKDYSEEGHVSRLLDLFESVIRQGNKRS
jgi:glycosyltransferase involved in cell wall biosynthesis